MKLELEIIETTTFEAFDERKLLTDLGNCAVPFIASLFVLDNDLGLRFAA